MITVEQAKKDLAEFFSDPSRWTTEYFARDAAGGPVEPDDPKAVCWCADGALQKLYGKDQDFLIMLAMGDEIRERDMSAGGLLSLNDDQGYEALMEYLRS